MPVVPVPTTFSLTPNAAGNVPEDRPIGSYPGHSDPLTDPLPLWGVLYRAIPYTLSAHDCPAGVDMYGVPTGADYTPITFGLDIPHAYDVFGTEYDFVQLSFWVPGYSAVYDSTIGDFVCSWASTFTLAGGGFPPTGTGDEQFPWPYVSSETGAFGFYSFDGLAGSRDEFLYDGCGNNMEIGNAGTITGILGTFASALGVGFTGHIDVTIPNNPAAGDYLDWTLYDGYFVAVYIYGDKPIGGGSPAMHNPSSFRNKQLGYYGVTGETVEGSGAPLLLNQVWTGPGHAWDQRSGAFPGSNPHACYDSKNILHLIYETPPVGGVTAIAEAISHSEGDNFVGSGGTGVFNPGRFPRILCTATGTILRAAILLDATATDPTTAPATIQATIEEPGGDSDATAQSAVFPFLDSRGDPLLVYPSSFDIEQANDGRLLLVAQDVDGLSTNDYWTSDDFATGFHWNLIT